MKMRIVLTIVALAFCLAASAAQAGNIVVIVNSGSGITAATADEVSKVFMGKSGSLGGTDVTPVDQVSDSETRTAFSEKILGRSVTKVSKYWKKLVFAGKGEPPAVFANDAKVIAHVSDTPDAVGYVSAGSLNDKVKAILVDGQVEW